MSSGFFCVCSVLVLLSHGMAVSNRLQHVFAINVRLQRELWCCVHVQYSTGFVTSLHDLLSARVTCTAGQLCWRLHQRLDAKLVQTSPCLSASATAPRRPACRQSGHHNNKMVWGSRTTAELVIIIFSLGVFICYHVWLFGFRGRGYKVGSSPAVAAAAAMPCSARPCKSKVDSCQNNHS
jgi:hypothetical protein